MNVLNQGEIRERLKMSVFWLTGAAGVRVRVRREILMPQMWRCYLSFKLGSASIEICLGLCGPEEVAERLSELLSWGRIGKMAMDPYFDCTIDGVVRGPNLAKVVASALANSGNLAVETLLME